MSVSPRMSDRLQELLRQRALVQEHLAWLDREIATADAAASDSEPGPAATSQTAVPKVGGLKLKTQAPAQVSTLRHSAAAILAHAATPAPAAIAPQFASAADAIIEEYRVPPATLKTDVRKGCFLYLVAAFAFVALVVVVLSYAFSARHQ